MPYVISPAMGQSLHRTNPHSSQPGDHDMARPTPVQSVTRFLSVAALLFGLVSPASADVTPFPASFHTQDIAANGATIHVRVGGHGPGVVLLHGFGDTGDMWAPLAIDLARDHTV